MLSRPTIVTVAFSIFVLVLLASIAATFAFFRHDPTLRVDGAAIGGFGAAIAAFLQVLVLLIQATILKEQTNIAARQTMLTEALLKHSEALPTWTDRAYVFLTIEASRLVWKNYGRTPAKAVMNWGPVGYGSLDDVPVREDLFRQYSSVSDKDVIGPGQEIDFPLKVSDAHSYVYGLVMYQDVFPDTPLHYSEYLFAVSRDQTGRALVPVGERYSDGDLPRLA